MAEIDINKVADSIKLIFPEEASEISEALDLVNLALEGLLNSINSSIAELHKNKDYDKSMELLELSKSVSEFQIIIEQCSLVTKKDNSIDEEELEPDLETEKQDETEERKSIPNYSDYIVDNSVPHKINESFTYKRVVAFSLNNIYSISSKRLEGCFITNM